MNEDALAWICISVTAIVALLFFGGEPDLMDAIVFRMLGVL